MIRRHASTVALLSAALIYAVLFLLLGGADMWVQLLAPAVFAALGAIGVKLMLSRDQREIADHTYWEDARALANSVRSDMGRVHALIPSVPDHQVQGALARACRTVPELLDRVAEDQPTSLYSSASKLQGHVSSLKGVVEAYLDLYANPDYYKDAPALAAQGKAAIMRFDEFTIETMQLLTQGDMAEYQANLDTVAPPAIPKLEG